MKKIVAIYFSSVGAYAYPFDKPEYLESYNWLINELMKHKIEVVVVRGDSYQGAGVFSKRYELKNNQFVLFERPIRADLIFNRDDKNTIPYIEDCAIINPARLDEICANKKLTSEIFPDLMPATYLSTSYDSAKNAINEIQSELVVLKPNTGTEGRGVVIVKPQQVNKSLYSDWNNIIVQEFCETSFGITGICLGRHDLRVTIINGRPIHSMLRIPKSGSYVSNIAQGGISRSVSLKDIPLKAYRLISSIDNKLSGYTLRFYSADIVNTEYGFMLIELNSHPGIGHSKFYDDYLEYNSSIAKLLINTVMNLGE